MWINPGEVVLKFFSNAPRKTTEEVLYERTYNSLEMLGKPEHSMVAIQDNAHSTRDNLMNALYRREPVSVQS